MAPVGAACNPGCIVGAMVAAVYCEFATGCASCGFCAIGGGVARGCGLGRLRVGVELPFV